MLLTICKCPGAIGKGSKPFHRRLAITVALIFGTRAIAPIIAERDINSIIVLAIRSVAATSGLATATGTGRCGAPRPLDRTSSRFKLFQLLGHADSAHDPRFEILISN